MIVSSLFYLLLAHYSHISSFLDANDVLSIIPRIFLYPLHVPPGFDSNENPHTHNVIAYDRDHYSDSTDWPFLVTDYHDLRDGSATVHCTSPRQRLLDAFLRKSPDTGKTQQMGFLTRGDFDEYRSDHCAV